PWQAVPAQFCPRDAAVSRSEEAAAGAAALTSPRVNLDLPHAGEQDSGIARIHRDVGAADLLVDEQRALPRRAAVAGAEHTALGLRTVCRAERARDDDVGVGGMDDDASDAAGFLESHARPRLARVGRLVDPVADRDVASDPRFASARPDDVVVGGCDG